MIEDSGWRVGLADEPPRTDIWAEVRRHACPTSQPRRSSTAQHCPCGRSPSTPPRTPEPRPTREAGPAAATAAIKTGDNPILAIFASAAANALACAAKPPSVSDTDGVREVVTSAPVVAAVVVTLPVSGSMTELPGIVARA